MEDHTEENRGHNDQETWRNHFLEGSLGGNLDAALVVRVDLSAPHLWVSELSSDFDDHLSSGDTNGLHGHGREGVWKHGTNEQRSENPGFSNFNIVDLVLLGVLGSDDEGSVESQGDQGSGSDGESLADGGSGVSGGVQSIGLFSDFVAEFGHFGDT